MHSHAEHGNEKAPAILSRFVFVARSVNYICAHLKDAKRCNESSGLMCQWLSIELRTSEP